MTDPHIDAIRESLAQQVADLRTEVARLTERNGRLVALLQSVDALDDGDSAYWWHNPGEALMLRIRSALAREKP